MGTNDITTSATRRDGTVITLNERVVTDFPGCEGRVFVVYRIVPYGHCESGYHVQVHPEDEPLRTLDDLDTNWFHHAQPLNDERPATDPRPGDGPGPVPAGRADAPADVPAAIPGDGRRRGGGRVGRKGDQQLGIEF